MESDALSVNLMNAELAARKWDFESPPPPIPDSSIAETIEADIVVVGEGLSGLATALSAVQHGISAVIVTGSSRPVGRGGSIFAAYSKVMQRAGFQPLLFDDFYLQEFAASSFSVDQRKWFRLHNHSEEAMNWLIDMVEEAGLEVVLEDANVDDVHSPTFQLPGTHAVVGNGIDFAGTGIMLALNVLESRFRALGGRVAYKNAAKQLVRQNPSGRICAVIARDSDGRFIKYSASKAVVLATGDFSANPDMMAKYCPAFANFFSKPKVIDYDVGFKERGLLYGDGHLMALWAGAAWQKTFPNAILVQGSRMASNMPYGSHRGLRLNSNGERFMNEDSNGAYTALSVLREPNQTAWAIWSKNYAFDIPWFPHGGRRGAHSLSPELVLQRWDALVNDSKISRRDSLPDLLDAIGLPKNTALSEIERYNSFCRSGFDSDFYKKSKYLQEISEPPYYAAKLDDIRFFSVLGGPRTNHLMQICDENDIPLGSLYAVGSMVGDMYANCYNFRIPGHNYGACLTFGYLTGKRIATLHVNEL